MRTGRPPKYPYLTKELVRDLYWEKERSVPQISREIEVPINTIRHFMERTNILQRNASEAHCIAIKYGVIRGVQLTLSKKQLYNLYWEQKYTLGDIAKTVGCSTDRVKREMEKRGIPRRTVSEAQNLAYETGRRIKRGRFQSNRDGYIHILNPKHHRATKAGWVLEHILVWEKTNEQLIPRGWVVHHLNGIKGDNKPENLLGMPRRDHNSQLQLKAMRQRIRELEATLEH